MALKKMDEVPKAAAEYAMLSVVLEMLDALVLDRRLNATVARRLASRKRARPRR
jgi:hypothetical protein